MHMPLNLCDYETKACDAIKAFWQTRDDAKQKQLEAGKFDQGERAGVTGGKNMDGFSKLVIELVKANGLPDAQIHQKRAVLTLPGYFRPTKLWDLLVIDKGRLVAALEFKSHVGPSFGNNFNNRTEEAIGTSHDLWTAYREGAFGAQERPFVGWLIGGRGCTRVESAGPRFLTALPGVSRVRPSLLPRALRHPVPAVGQGAALLFRIGHRHASFGSGRWFI
jgi:hypothetical protein